MLSFSKAGAKVLLFFDMTKYFDKKMHKNCIFFVFLPKYPLKSAVSVRFWGQTDVRFEESVEERYVIKT